MRFETEGQVEVRVEWCQQEQTVNSEADFNYIKMWLLQKRKKKTINNIKYEVEFPESLRDNIL